MGERSGLMGELRGIVGVLLQCFGPVGKDVFVRTRMGQVLLTNRGKLVLENLPENLQIGPCTKVIVESAAKKTDFSVSFVFAAYALCVVLARFRNRFEALREIDSVVRRFDELFDVRSLAARRDNTEEMQRKIAESGISGKLNSENCEVVITATKELIGEFRYENISKVAKEWPVVRCHSTVKVGKHTVVIKGTCTRIVCNRTNE